MSDFYTDRDTRGIPVELVLLQLCHLRGIPAHLNPAPESDLARRAAYDLLIADIPVDVKADWLSWRTRNICVEERSLQHTEAEYFIYAFPLPSGLHFHVFPVVDLVALYNAKNRVRNRDGLFHEVWVHPHRIVGDQASNMAALLPMEIREVYGEPFWKWAKNINQLQAA